MNERAYDDQGRVRPADGRFRGEGVTDPAELAKVREQEIADGVAQLAERKAAEEAANQKRAEDAGWVNTTTPEYLEQERARMRDARKAAQAKQEQPVRVPEDGDPQQPAPAPEMPLSEMMQHPEADGAPVVDTTDQDDQADQYDGMDFQALREAAKSRDLNAGGTADELKARLRDADAGRS